jgi:Ca-activated chloride channel homolog
MPPRSSCIGAAAVILSYRRDHGIMGIRRFVSLNVALLLVSLSGVAAFGQGIIVPRPCERRPCVPRPQPPPLPTSLPVKSISINTEIDGQVATTHVEQVFRNDTQFTLEGTYFFPIPETAAITEWVIWENGKRLVGEVQSREEARRIYDEIVRRQRDPGLLEYAGKDLFQASIFPIPPMSDKKLELTYTEVLKSDSGTIGYRYPLGTGRNIWRNSTVDRSAVSQTFGTVTGSIEIKGQAAIRNIYSPTHDIDVKRKGETGASVSFETKNNDNDVQLYFSASNDDFGASLITHREPGKDGYFMLTLSPRDDLAEKQVVNKDIVFVLDTSGSMSDEGKMDKARNALLFGIRTLRDGDRFNVINFAGDEHLMEPRLIEANAAGRLRGEEFVKTLRPTGGTNINDALLTSIKQFEKGSRPRMLVFMTDGLATVGERNTLKIIENLNRAKSVDIRIFPFGFGYDVNTELLDTIGAENGGISDYVQPKEDLEAKMSSFFAKVSSPVLSDLSLDLGSAIVDQMYPRKLPDVFRGMQLIIIGRYKNTNDLRNITFRLTGKSGSGTRTFNYGKLDLPVRNSDNDFLPRLWASRRVGWLIEQIRLNGESKELRDEIIELGTRFGLVTPYTSYLATDGTMVNATRSEARRLAPAAANEMRQKTGDSAVRMSLQQNSMQGNARAVASDSESKDDIVLRNSAQNQFVANKSFVNQSGVWVDVDLVEGSSQRTVKVRFGSDEYYDLVSRTRELGQYFAIGKQVTVVWNDIIYMVVE